MAQRVEILLTDDLDGRDLPAGKGETVTFALHGSSYEIDLGTKNAAALRKALAVYIEAARPIRNRRAKKVTRSTIGADARTVKAWARANGYEVNDRGRVPADIRNAFEAAN
ncbi:Lsr2 family protein [Kribbella sp. VKM Ac-2568]|uniref:histone-like nucleoid-structuring protein Lsr2 n=1 Tax=Kribbella sp. VKM Ac-2568 TaxID=2512219 RepID=UPI00104CAEC5|nr:Lsr2 family protein [Kribbella sp. VKM Ac-2568]TCM42765.1 Lsr2 protein [Kribbella sp. VKM Ac-2568]